MKAIVLTPNGTATAVDIDPNNTLKEMQSAVGGYIEMLELTEGLDMVINEEGKIYQLDPNPLALKLSRIYRLGLASTDYIAGTAILIGSNSEGETIDVPEEVIDSLNILGAELAHQQ